LGVPARCVLVFGKMKSLAVGLYAVRGTLLQSLTRTDTIQAFIKNETLKDT
jgi:hypothetical protein